MAASQPADLNAIELLKQDHRKVEALFKEFETLKDDDEDAASVVIESACAELKIHDAIETEIFYPGVLEQADDGEVEDLVNEAEVEHDSVRALIEKLDAMEPDDDMRKAHFTVLMEYVKHHVEEEEKEMFPKVSRLKGLDLAELGEEMAERKEELKGEMGLEATETDK